ncbi:MAG TPA: hypothetical protein VNY82_03110 [Steroidobacteraceae bacterium]|nr:hypothetical protein [Steroidobacteraceae bacterium]
MPRLGDRGAEERERQRPVIVTRIGDEVNGYATISTASSPTASGVSPGFAAAARLKHSDSIPPNDPAHPS